MSSEEFNLWLEYYPEDLWGDMRGFECAGVIASTVANWAGRSLKQGAQPLKPQDFMPTSGEPEEEVEADPLAYFQAIAAAAQDRR